MENFNIKTFEIILIITGVFLIFRRKYSKNRAIRNTVARYIKIINMILVNDKDGLSAMEYNDRYTIIFNKGELSKFGMIRLLKSEKKLLILEESLLLTDKEYNNLLETLKPIL